jgi:hypothetical protein
MPAVPKNSAHGDQPNAATVHEMSVSMVAGAVAQIRPDRLVERQPAVDDDRGREGE